MKKDIILAAVVASLAFIGGVLGAFVSSALDSSKWETQVKYEQNIVLLQQRIRLIERTSIIFGKLPRIEVLSKIIKIKSKVTDDLLVLCRKEYEKNGTAKSCDEIEDSSEHTSMFNEIVDLQAELNATLIMNSLYFCDKTKKAMLEIQHETEGTISKETMTKILSAMVSETHCKLLEF